MRIWLNGKIVDEGDAVVSAFDHGFTVGDGVFETMKVTPAGPFALTRHLDRLTFSARGLGLPDVDLATVRDAVADVLDGADGPGRLRITYTGGPSPLGSDRGSDGTTLVVALVPLGSWPGTTAVATVPWPRNERGPCAGLKTTSYADNVVALARAKAQGASEAIFPNTVGELCEGTGSNVFLELNGAIVTPSLRSGCLAGVTRALVVEWFEVPEVEVPMTALFSASEVFLTSTTRDVQPVSSVDGRQVGSREAGDVGPMTASIRARFTERAAQDLDP